MSATSRDSFLKLHLWAPALTGFGGGIGAFSAEMCRALGDAGHELRLFGKMDRSGDYESFPLVGMAAQPAMLRIPAFAAAALTSIARDRPDHVISTHVNFGPVAHLARKLFGTPFTLVAHGIDVQVKLPRLTLAALRAADRLIAVSGWTKQGLLQLGGIEPARVGVVPNTVDGCRFTVGPKPDSLARRYGIDPDEKVILSVARLDAGERYKGYDRIVEALASIQSACGRVRFILAGGGDDRARVETLARKLGVSRAVTFTGFVPDDELPDHYRLADAFAMPSTGEGFGIVFLEAMACGTPVMGGNRDGSVDALEDGRLGMLVDPGDTSAIAAGLIALLQRRGPAFWFDRDMLHDAVISRFGRAAFREKLRDVMRL